MFFVLVIVALIIAALPLTVVAQEGGKPDAVGLRPDAPPYALHGPYWVGTREFVIEPDSERPLPLTVWYPALNPDDKPEEITYIYENFATIEGFTQPGHAIANAVPDTANGPYSLVIVSHGLAEYRYAHAYLAEHLASHGFVVMAIDHPSNTLAYVADPKLRRADWSGFTEGLVTALIYRPADVQRQIDYAHLLTAQAGNLPGSIDIDHVAVVGHSFGGYTALVSAGAQVDLGPEKDWCVENAGDEAVTTSERYWLHCQLMLPSESRLLRMRGLDLNPGEMWPPFDVTGVDAIVPIGAGTRFSPESFGQVTVPVLLMVGTKEDGGDTYKDAVMTYGSVSSDRKGLVAFEDADYFFSLSRCVPWFYEHQMTTACAVEPVWDIDRAHDLINHFTTAFLLAVLKNDADAAAALTPDAVSFPGITYEATEF
jgi:predicted dienelactone hydrolase